MSSWKHFSYKSGISQNSLCNSYSGGPSVTAYVQREETQSNLCVCYTKLLRGSQASFAPSAGFRMGEVYVQKFLTPLSVPNYKPKMSTFCLHLHFSLLLFSPWTVIWIHLYHCFNCSPYIEMMSFSFGQVFLTWTWPMSLTSTRGRLSTRWRSQTT